MNECNVCSMNECNVIVSARLLAYAIGNIDQTNVKRRIAAGKIPQPDAYIAGRRTPSWTLAAIRAWNPAIANRIAEIDSQAAA